MRPAEVAGRITEEAGCRAERGHLVFFGTGTYSDAHMVTVERGSGESRCKVKRPLGLLSAREVLGFLRREYAHSVRELVKGMCKRLGLPYRAGQKALAEHFSQIWIVERGSGDKTHRLHMHWLWFIDIAALPDAWLDGSVRSVGSTEMPYVRELSMWWRLGRCRVQPARSKPNDAFGQLGWAWPMRSQAMIDGSVCQIPMEAPGGARAISGYLAGYVGSDGGLPRDVRKMGASRGFGLGRLREELEGLADRRDGRRLLRALSCSSDCADALTVNSDSAVGVSAMARYAMAARFRAAERRHPVWVRRLMARRRPIEVGAAVYSGVQAAIFAEREIAAGDAYDGTTGEVLEDVGPALKAVTDLVSGELRRVVRGGGLLRRRKAAARWHLASFPGLERSEPFQVGTVCSAFQDFAPAHGWCRRGEAIRPAELVFEPARRVTPKRVCADRRYEPIQKVAEAVSGEDGLPTIVRAA